MGASDTLLYKEAGVLYCKVAAGVCNLKNALFQSNFKSDLKKLLAIVGEAVKNRQLLVDIYKRYSKDEVSSGGKYGLECGDGSGCTICWTKVQIHDMLFGQAKSNTCGCPLVSKMRLVRAAADEIAAENGVSNYDELRKKFQPEDKGIKLPVYVRINRCLVTMEEAIAHFQQQGYNFLPFEEGSVKYNQFQAWLAELGEADFMPDFHLHSDVLVFHAGSSFYKDAWVSPRQKGETARLHVQDKASCVPAVLLDPRPGQDVIDACAAPGNKTSQLVSLLADQMATDNGSSTTTIWAMDKDRVRCESLRLRMVALNRVLAVGGRLRVNVENCDFSHTDPKDPKFANVATILLDPSCSGSGMMRHIDRVAERDAGARVDSHRLQSLRNFQSLLLGHALSFPSVQRVVYSTCSVTLEENEYVVQETLEKFGSHFQLVPAWADKWMTRGKKGAKECLRANPGYDLCNGFFMAVFQRTQDGAPSASDVVFRAVNSRKIREGNEGRGDGATKKKKRRPKKNKIDRRNRPRPADKLKMQQENMVVDGDEQVMLHSGNDSGEKNKNNVEESKEKMEMVENCNSVSGKKKKSKKNKNNGEESKEIMEVVENNNIDSGKKKSKKNKNNGEESKEIMEVVENDNNDSGIKKSKKNKNNGEESKEIMEVVENDNSDTGKKKKSKKTKNNGEESKEIMEVVENDNNDSGIKKSKKNKNNGEESKKIMAVVENDNNDSGIKKSKKNKNNGEESKKIMEVVENDNSDSGKKKKSKKNKNNGEESKEIMEVVENDNSDSGKKKSKKNKNNGEESNELMEVVENDNNDSGKKKKSKKNKNNDSGKNNDEGSKEERESKKNKRLDEEINTSKSVACEKSIEVVVDVRSESKNREREEKVIENHANNGLVEAGIEVIGKKKSKKNKNAFLDNVEDTEKESKLDKKSRKRRCSEETFDNSSVKKMKQ